MIIQVSTSLDDGDRAVTEEVFLKPEIIKTKDPPVSGTDNTRINQTVFLITCITYFYLFI